MSYGRHVYLAGEEFTAASTDAKTLVATGLAARIESDAVPALLAPAPTETRELTAEPKKRGRPRKGAYLRRDMRAEE